MDHYLRNYWKVKKESKLERKKSYYKDVKTINLLISILSVCLSSYSSLPLKHIYFLTSQTFFYNECVSFLHYFQQHTNTICITHQNFVYAWGADCIITPK